MSNARKARGTKASETGHAWADKTFRKPLPVRGIWMMPASGPVIWADASSRLDVKDLARAHREALEGAVFTQWMLALSQGSVVQVLLLVRFMRPVRTEFALAFEPDHMEALSDIATAGRVSMVTREPTIGNGSIECRNVMSFEIDQPGLRETLDKMPAL